MSQLPADQTQQFIDTLLRAGADGVASISGPSGFVSLMTPQQVLQAYRAAQEIQALAARPAAGSAPVMLRFRRV